MANIKQFAQIYHVRRECFQNMETRRNKKYGNVSLNSY